MAFENTPCLTIFPIPNTFRASQELHLIVSKTPLVPPISFQMTDPVTTQPSLWLQLLQRLSVIISLCQPHDQQFYNCQGQQAECRKWQESPFKKFHIMNCWAKHNRLNSQVAQAGVMPLEPVEPCPSRSAGFWLSSYKQLCAKDQLPKSKELQLLSCSGENKVGSAQGWHWNAETQLKHRQETHKTTQSLQCHTTAHAQSCLASQGLWSSSW